MTDKSDDALQAALLAETSTITWKELQYFFAGGKAIFVSSELDLVKTAAYIASDNRAVIEQWSQIGKIAPVSSQQAKTWYETDATVWAVVVKPWVLVQEVKSNQAVGV